MESKPKVSVVMSVYNGEKTLQRAIESILNQTFRDFEFIIVNDGSVDKSQDILEKYGSRDGRIKIMENTRNLGLTKSLNIAVRVARGEYIARQDADDESLPERLEKQVKFMEKHPEVILLGTNWYEIDDKAGSRIGRYYNMDTISKIVYILNPIPHTSVMFRKGTFLKIGLYDESFTTSQDFEAWMRMAEIGKIAMLKEPLVKVYHTGRGRIGYKKRFLQCMNATRARFMHPKLGINRAITSSIYQWISAYAPKAVIRLKRTIFRELV